MHYTNIINNLSLAENIVTMEFKDAVEVVHYDGDYVDGALKKTKFLEELSRVMSYEGIRDAFEDAWYYDEDEELPTKEQIQEQIFSNIKEDVWDYVSERLEMWSSKKGLCHLTTELKISPLLLRQAEENGLTLDERWKIKVETLDGELILNS